MGSPQWPQGSRLRSAQQLWPWFVLLLVLGLVRLSKGAGFADGFALLSRPFWPGTAQREWVEAAQQQEQISRLELLERDNARLRELLALDQQSSGDWIQAAVISRTASGWWQQLILGKGSVEGVAKDDAVIGPGGLIGRVQSVTPTTSRVRLLTAPGSRIGVWLPRTQQHGLLAGLGTARPQLQFLDKDIQVRPGDLVSTSPASTLLPPNLPVAVVQSLNARAVPAPTALVQLIAPPDAIDWVQVKVR
ncbi:rod shape-determining protein MreC [Synechococcus sp. MIT S9503]|uniref:rod shape-determining protein MreC n=1 Tax=Synechococcus sp. MIT S9503 TaxID=3082547 RepID=UPI0039A75F87|tara:strand:- start:8 stop:751 length:744 start_codon:yes stop_codon:yes gene_type:complete